MQSSFLEPLHKALEQAIADKHYAGATEILRLIKQYEYGDNLAKSAPNSFAGCFLSDWIAYRGCCKSTAYRMRAELRAALGIESEKRRNGNKLEAWLSPEHQELFNAYANYLDRGLSVGEALAQLGRPDLSPAALQATSAAAKDAQLTICDGIEQSPRQEGFWLNLLISKYIPMKIGKGELFFSSPELMKWVDESSQVALTKHDFTNDSSKTFLYKRLLSNALTALKKQSIISSKLRGKRYFINQTSFEAFRCSRGPS